MDISADNALIFAASVFVPVALYLGGRVAKRMDQIAAQVGEIAREVTRHATKWEEIESDTKSWYRERDDVLKRVQLLEARQR